MPRYFAPISENVFKTKLTEAATKFLENQKWDDIFQDKLDQWPDNPNKWEFAMTSTVMSGFTPKIMEDLSKIKFDFENCEYESGDPTIESLMGVRTLDNGLTFFGMYAGGDWEFPVYFIIYWDGKQFRGYLPEKGNVFNEKYRCAYGSEEDTLYAKDPTAVFPEEDEWDGESEFSWDMEAIKADIMDRIKLKS